jgi:hypothetical protein
MAGTIEILAKKLRKSFILRGYPSNQVAKVQKEDCVTYCGFKVFPGINKCQDPMMTRLAGMQITFFVFSETPNI